jgi:hypothetical protein
LLWLSVLLLLAVLLLLLFVLLLLLLLLIGTHSAGGVVGAAQGMASSKPVVAGSAQRLHRQQQGVLREAYRRRVESAVVVGFVVGCVMSEKDGPRRCYEVGEGADDARTGQEKKWEEWVLTWPWLGL